MLWPTQVHVFNIYETNGGGPERRGVRRPNIENWDASGEQAPKNGDKGGELAPVDHTTIDNSKSIKKRIIDDAMAHSN